MLLFRNVSRSRGKSITRFAGSPFFTRKVTIFIGRETKTHIVPTKMNEKNSLRSADLTINSSFRLTLPFNNNNTGVYAKRAHSLVGVTFPNGPQLAARHRCCAAAQAETAAVVPLQHHSFLRTEGRPGLGGGSRNALHGHLELLADFSVFFFWHPSKRRRKFLKKKKKRKNEKIRKGKMNK